VTLLESVLVATPREFESRVLRFADQPRCQKRLGEGSTRSTPMVSILVSVEGLADVETTSTDLW
jgi:hypothetical protein